MKNEQLDATVDMTCNTCRTTVKDKNITLHSEKICHLICKQCGYEVLEAVFKFEKTNFGIYVQKRPAWDTEYSVSKKIGPQFTLVTTFTAKTGEVILSISGDQ